MDRVDRTAEGWKLWLYTNYDCNLRCRYCVARSEPEAPRRALGLDRARRLVEEAAELGFGGVYLTGGEPFLLPEIFDIIHESTSRLPTTVLTNGTLVVGKRLDRLAALASENLHVQVSVDGGRPEHHDPWRGKGTWQKAIQAVERLVQNGISTCLATTKTSENAGSLRELCDWHRNLGIPEDRHVVRLLTRRGFADEGAEVGVESLSPELTADRAGLYWHPISTDDDLLVSRDLFPLADGVAAVQMRLAELDARRVERKQLR